MGRRAKASLQVWFFLSCFKIILEDFIKYHNASEDSCHFDINFMMGLTCRKSRKFKYHKQHDNFCSYRIRLLKTGCVRGLPQRTCTHTNTRLHSVTNASLPEIVAFLMFRGLALKYCKFHCLIHTLCLLQKWSLCALLLWRSKHQWPHLLILLVR